MIYEEGIFVTVGDAGTILTSSDGMTWIRRNSGTARNLKGVTYGNGIFIAVGEAILTSPDGIIWTEPNPTHYSPPYDLKAVAYGNGYFVAVGYDWILVSADGVAWINRLVIDNFFELAGVAYGNGTFIVVGMGGEFGLSRVILTSSDGLIWTKRWGGAYITGVFYENGLFIGTGYGVFLISPDGVAYETILKINNSLYGITYGNGTFVVVGEYGTILQSDPVNISSIELQMPLNDSHFNACSLDSAPTFTWSTGEVFENYEIHFSLDSNFLSIPVKKKISGNLTEILITSNDWKEILSIPGKGGGTIYWRVVGIHLDQTTVTSEIRSIIVDPPQAVGAPTISPTSKDSLPELSWQNNCNTKFKVYFGNDANFTRKASYSFIIKKSTEAEFSKALTFGQWKDIRRLTGDQSGSTIYWYVESWDGLKRYAKTDLKTFLLTD